MLLAPEVILWLIIMSMYSLLINDHRADKDPVILKMFVSFFFHFKHEDIIKLIFFTEFIILVGSSIK